MCGLVGVAGSIVDKHEKAYKQLLILDSVRGLDSTGTAFVSEDGDVDVVKVVGHPFDLIDNMSHNRRMARKNRVLLGHNRFATQGQINKQNAHPFEFENLVGAHNGTLLNKHELPNGHQYTVDSQALFACMNTKGVKDTIPLLRGAWALTWWDKKEKTLNFIRNKERPLYLAMAKYGTTLYWASEKWMLHIACGRNDLQIDEPEEIEEDVLYTFDLSKVTGPELVNKEGLKGAAPFRQVHTFPTGGSTQTSHHSRNTSPVTHPTTGVTHLANTQSGWVAGLAGDKKLTVEGMLVVTDMSGATYISCVSDKYPYTEFRLYVNRKDGDPKKYVDKKIIADVGKFHQVAGLGKGYYKLDYSSHKWHPDSLPTIGETLYQGAHGEELDEASWVKKYGKCCWCNSDIKPKDTFAFASNNETICSDCLSDPEICDFVTKVVNQ